MNECDMILLKCSDCFEIVYYYRFQIIVRVVVFRIIPEWKGLESCGFHRSKEHTQEHQSMSKFYWSAIDQSGEFLLDIFVNDIRTSFFIELCLPIRSFDRKNNSLSIYARTTLLTCSVQVL